MKKEGAAVDDLFDEFLKLAEIALTERVSYDERKVAEKFEVDGLSVSTAEVEEGWFETALCDMAGAHPVERYPDREAAELGHLRWIEFAKNRENECVMELGYGKLIPEELIFLRRKGE